MCDNEIALSDFKSNFSMHNTWFMLPYSVQMMQQINMLVKSK